MLAVGIIIWVIGIVYGAITFYRLKKTKKEYEEAQREEIDATAESLRQVSLPNNDSGQEEKYQRDETIDYLIELSDNSVPITLSSLIRTLYNEPGYTLENIKKGIYGYGDFLDTNSYKTINIAYRDKNRNWYEIYIIDSNYPCTPKKAKLDDQVLIIKIEKDMNNFKKGVIL